MTTTFLRILVEASVRAVVIGVLVESLLLALRVRSSGARHASRTIVVCAMLLMPVLPSLMPGIEVPRPNWPADTRSVDAVPADVPQTTQISASSRTDSARSMVEPRMPEATFNPALGAFHRVARWPPVLLAAYLLGVFVLAARLMLGWWAAERLARASQSIRSGLDASLFAASDGVSIAESIQVATPVTVGVIAPTIILPTAWRLWPAWKVRAVLAHECAHVRRRDPLVAFVAAVNHCIFWFHPLAWWLKRELAASAEHASDDEAVREVGAADRYAEILLEMASAVREQRGRFVWDGIGIDGSGLLGKRIDRVLRAGLPNDVSRMRRLIIVASCLIAVLLVAACRLTPPDPPPLRANPELTELRAEEAANTELVKVVEALTTQQVVDLDAQWQRNPEDLVALKKLLIFYKHDYSGRKNPNQDTIIAARRPYILWLIAHHPEHELAGDWAARIFATPLDPLPDPAGHAEARQLWLAHTSKPNTSTAVLSNAALFFEVNDKALAEEMLLRAQAEDPQGSWSRRLGRLYALILMGANASMNFNVLRYTSLADSRSAYAQVVRAKLEASRDDVLLTTAADYLTRNARFFSQKRGEIDFDPASLGESYFARALELNPQSAQARAALVRKRANDRYDRIHQTLRQEPKVPEEEALSRLSEADRFAALPGLADTSYFMNENAENQQDHGGAKAARERSRAYALAALKLAPKFVNSPDYSMSVFTANMTLSALAMWDGDKKAALKYMRAASMVPASDELAYLQFFAARRPIAHLLKYGERDSVIEYLERMAKISVIEKEYLLESATAIRRGQAPSFYTVQIRD